MERVKIEPGKIGVFSIEFQRYWKQFPGLRERLERYREDFERRIKGFEGGVASKTDL